MPYAKMLLVCLTLSSIASCAATPAPGECTWAALILVSPRDVLTRGTREQIVVHNRQVERFCRR